MQRLPRPAVGPIPEAFLNISHVEYLPKRDDNIAFSFFKDRDGLLHSDKSCSSGSAPVANIPTVGQWLGLEQDLCFCVPIPEEILIARNILRASQQFPNLPTIDGVTETNITSVASRVMQTRRFLVKLDTLISDAEQGGTSVLCRARRSVSEDLVVRSTSIRLSIDSLIRRQVVIDALTHSTGDRTLVTAAFDAYLPHPEETSSVDGDLADFATAAFTTARTGDRVAVRAPRGIVQFVALYRNGGGFVEADVNTDHDPKVTETALVLWEPNTTSTYSRWPAALQAAAKLR